MPTYKKLSTLVEQQFPEFVRTDGPQFVAFLEAYYEWMEQDGNAIDANKNLLSYRDIDTTLDAYVAYFQDEFMATIPQSHIADNGLTTKNIIDYHRSRGSEKSYKFLFRILYNDNVDFYYPGRDILRASDGRWVIAKTLRAENLTSPTAVFEMEGFEITGGDSGATAIVEQVLQTIVAGADVYTLTLKNIEGTFAQPEIITSSNGYTASTTSTINTAAGQYVGTNGFLSWDKYLQDNYFYQEYSYVLKSNQFVNKYRNVLKKAVHPSGTILFGEIAFTDILDVSTLFTASSTLCLTLVDINSQIADAVDASSFINTFKKVTIESTAQTPIVLSGPVDPYIWMKIDGTVDFANGANTINGSGTTFTDLQPSTLIFIRDNDSPGTNPDAQYQITSVGSDVLLDVTQLYEYATMTGGELYFRTIVEMFVDYGRIALATTEPNLDYELVAAAETVLYDYENIL